MPHKLTWIRCNSASTKP